MRGKRLAMYQSEMIYMGLHRDGTRLGSAGFLRVEIKDGDGSLSLRLKNIPPAISGRFPVQYFCGGAWKEADGVTLREGVGEWDKKERDSVDKLRLRILLPDGYLVEGASRSAAQAAPIPEAELAGASAEDRSPAPGTENVSAAQAALSVSAQMTQPSVSEAFAAGGAAIPDISAVQTTAPPASAVPAARDASARIPAPSVAASRTSFAHVPLIVQPRQTFIPTETVLDLKEDKWEQILDTYDRIHPYGDERLCVKLAPKDFLILSAKYQCLVNNSFLLHGYYNYRYVILGKEGDYYLGVPGIFYEREKMVALMFGFEAFECESGEAKEGDFGYYLRKVEL